MSMLLAVSLTANLLLQRLERLKKRHSINSSRRDA
jgi:hypothetical protein